MTTTISRGTKTRSMWMAVGLTAAGLSLGATQAQAVNLYWRNVDSDITVGTNWATGSAAGPTFAGTPGAGDALFFTGAPTVQPSFPGSSTFARLEMGTAPGIVFNAAPGATLTLLGTGTGSSSAYRAANSLTINVPMNIVLGAPAGMECN